MAYFVLDTKQRNFLSILLGDLDFSSKLSRDEYILISRTRNNGKYKLGYEQNQLNYIRSKWVAHVDK